MNDFNDNFQKCSKYVDILFVNDFKEDFKTCSIYTHWYKQQSLKVWYRMYGGIIKDNMNTFSLIIILCRNWVWMILGNQTIVHNIYIVDI